MFEGLHTFVDGEPCPESPLLNCVRFSHRESRTQEIDAYTAGGKIPVEEDLSRHPEKSIEARGCMSITLLGAGRSWDSPFAGLMGRVAAAIKEIKPAQDM